MKKLPVVPESIYDLVSVEDPQLSPDGRMVAFVHMQPEEDGNTYRRSIWLAPADGSQPPQALTRSGKDHSPRWSPDGSQVVFVSGRDGSPQLYVMPVTGGEARPLTRMVGGASSPRWSPDGRWIAYNSLTTSQERQLEDQGVLYDPVVSGVAAEWSKDHRARLQDPRQIDKLPYRTGTSFFDGKYRHIYAIPAAGGTPRRLSHGDFHHSAPEWTPDSKAVLANSNREQSSGDEFFELWSSVIRFDLDTAAEQVIVFEVSEEGRGVEISPDGKWVAHPFVPKVPSPYQEPYYVAVSPLQENATPLVISGEALTVIDFKWASDSEHLYFLLHSFGDGRLVRIPRTGGEVQPVVDGHFMVTAFSLTPDGKTLAYTVSAPGHPSDLFVMDVKSGQSSQLTRFNQGWEERHALSLPIEVRYTGEKQLEVQGWYLRPAFFEPGKSYPLAVEIHGGPQVMWGNSYWHEFQVLASRGYFVFYCNPRGSSGYGADFQRAREKGGYTDMADIMTGMDTVLKMEPQADAERLAVTGGSYGGFLTGWVVTHTDRFKAAVAQRGVYDELNMFGSGDIPESVEWYHGGIPSPENLAELWEYSPAAHAKNVTTPLLLKHSELDYRVPISQAETFFAYLRRSGNRTTSMVRFPREGHELSRAGEPHHRVQRLWIILNWFDKYIAHDGARSWALSAQEIAGLPGWELQGGSLVRRVACGTYDIAAGMAQRIAAVLKEYQQTAGLQVDGSSLEIRLANAGGAVTTQEAALARKLNRRIFNEKE